MESTDRIDFDDIQGLVVRGYGGLPAAAYLLLRISDRHRARPWLRDLVGQITFARLRPEHSALNLALSHHGLVSLGLDSGILEGFSNEFRSGMTTAHKRRIFGDEGDSAPENWLWGGPDTAPVDVLLMCYAIDDTALGERIQDLEDAMAEHGLELITRLDTQTLPEFREHFGFRDSIGQPYVEAFDRRGNPRPHPVPVGEILLGYRNGYQRFTRRPLVEPPLDTAGVLADDPEGSSLRDLGLNGTYLVFRQLAQDVPGFWRNARKHAASIAGDNPDPIRLASKMVGRWPSGTALTQSPERDDDSIADKDDFRYHASDADGMKCPLGAHIRRTHPRDSLDPEPGSAKSIAFSNRHRLLRRGRVYGEPFDPSLDPARFLDRLDQGNDQVSRGLHFICLNANIGRQFEFVQHTWANNPNFNGLYRDPDPLIGARHAHGLPQDRFTIQQQPARCKLQGLPAFVQTRGGGYFFLPSRRALQFLFTEGGAQ